VIGAGIAAGLVRLNGASRSSPPSAAALSPGRASSLSAVRKARQAGVPMHLIAHET